MENLYNLNDIDMLPGFVSRNGKYGKLKISRDGNLWIINYSNFKELLTSSTIFQEAFNEALKKIKDGKFDN